MMVYLLTEERIRERREIELLCNIANLLPVHKRIILRVYCRDGYRYAEIGQVLVRSAVTVSRRIEHARRDAVAIRDATNTRKPEERARRCTLSPFEAALRNTISERN